MDRFADRLYVICIRYMSDKETARDLLQEAFLKIFNNIKSYDPEKASLYTWMSTITVRTCLRKLEKGKLDVVHIENDEVEVPFESKVLDDLKTKDLIAIVNLLPSGYRDVFNMYVIDGFTHKEVSEMLNISEASSRTRLKRAKDLLKRYIQKIEIGRSWKNII